MCFGIERLGKVLKFLFCLPCLFAGAVVLSYFLGLIFKATYISVRDGTEWKQQWHIVDFWEPFDPLTVWFGTISFIGVMVFAFVFCLIDTCFCYNRRRGLEDGNQHHHHWHIEDKGRERKEMEKKAEEEVTLIVGDNVEEIKLE